jgi:hypothetical protein
MLRKRIRALDESIQFLEARQKIHIFVLIREGEIRSGEAKFLWEKLFKESSENQTDPSEDQFTQMENAMKRWQNGYND